MVVRFSTMAVFQRSGLAFVGPVGDSGVRLAAGWDESLFCHLRWAVDPVCSIMGVAGGNGRCHESRSAQILGTCQGE